MSPSESTRNGPRRSRSRLPGLVGKLAQLSTKLVADAGVGVGEPQLNLVVSCPPESFADGGFGGQDHVVVVAGHGLPERCCLFVGDEDFDVETHCHEVSPLMLRLTMLSQYRRSLRQSQLWGRPAVWVVGAWVFAECVVACNERKR